MRARDPGTVETVTGEPNTPLLSVALSFVLPDGEINGTLRLDGGTAQAWYAQPARHADFLRAHTLADQRPWAAADVTGEGYEFHLPAELDAASPALRQRVALGLEEFIYLTRDGKLTGNYHRQLDLSAPAWDLNVPRVIA